MKSTYTFLSSQEPSDKQLENLMKAVLVDVKKRSEIGKKKLASIQIKEIKEAKLRFKLYYSY